MAVNRATYTYNAIKHAECASVLDDNEVKAAAQTRSSVTVAGSVDKDGIITVPLAGITFPKFYVFSAQGGVIDIIPAVSDRLIPTGISSRSSRDNGWAGMLGLSTGQGCVYTAGIMHAITL